MWRSDHKTSSKTTDVACVAIVTRPKRPRYVHPRYKEKYRVITKTYREGQTFTAKVKITANHRGFFEFLVGKLVAAPMTNMKLTHLLELENGGTR